MIAPSPFSPFGDPRQAALRVGSGARTRHEVVVFALLAPCFIYLASLWVVRPAPISYATPLLLLLGAVAIKTPRGQVIAGLGRLRFELLLLVAMAALCFLSLANSSEPVRAFRILFPCTLPFLITWHLIALRSVSAAWVLAIPRLLLGAALVFSIAPFLASFVLPPLKDYVFGLYRLKCFFENSIQHAIALAVLAPVLATEIAISKGRRRRAILIGVLILFAFTLFRSGSKTAMFLSLVSGIGLYALIKARSQSVGRTLVMAIMILIGLLFLWVFGLGIAERLNPTIGGKLREIAEGGVGNYQSVNSRQLLWEEALQRGKEHWLVGSGAGTKVLGVSHAHNLVLDYFKGIGLFGAAAVVTLCLLIFGRTFIKGAAMIRHGGDDRDKRVLACYVGASVYVLLNQMSDCFGPSTIGFLWVLYLSGVLSDRSCAAPQRARRPPLAPATPWGSV